MPILPNIGRETTREDIINLQKIINVNTASVMSNLRGGCHGHLSLMMAAEDYLDQTGHAFFLTYNPVNFPLTMGTAQEKSLGTERF